ncbi:peptidylprolyl isomerase [Phenylobacterium sp.]|uniref:peptidylprolyl isomerase n=1 Tax=Phenylobacterium sp. TaxID=1871053 RepID=UPI002E2EA5FA|nr:peptidylprolyl isomerase [Phenylobacterium sp.]HEX3366960.1 peptidylprolyl isomerase [Phenylobacterium sp.]
MIATAILAVALPISLQAQPLRGAVGAPPPATQPAAPVAASAPTPANYTPMRPMSESVAAIVNDDIISTYDLAQRMRLLIATTGVQPTQENVQEFQQQALLSLVDETLQIQELKRVQKDQKISIIATDDEVQDELSGMAQQNNMKPEAFIAVLKSQGITSQTLFDQIRAQMSWQRWIRGRYGTRLRIGEDQIKATQVRMIAAASKPQYEVSEVFLDAGRTGGMDAAVKGATQLVAQLQQGAPFPAVARQFSASSTAAAGGDAGWISQGEMPAAVDTALDQLRPGQLSQPIPVKDGVYIIYLRDKRAGSGQTLVSLKQAAIALPADASAADVAAAKATLVAVRSQIKDCATLESSVAKTPGVVAGDLGEAETGDLLPEFAEAAKTLQPGQLSQPIRTKVGLHVLAVCGKRAAGAAQVDHDQIESRLTGQQLSMISRRYMRDLRNSATIETR